MKYFYIHTNGVRFEKPALVVEMGGGPHVYFDSPFVKQWGIVTCVDCLNPVVCESRKSCLH